MMPKIMFALSAILLVGTLIALFMIISQSSIPSEERFLNDFRGIPGLIDKSVGDAVKISQDKRHLLIFCKDINKQCGDIYALRYIQTHCPDEVDPVLIFHPSFMKRDISNLMNNYNINMHSVSLPQSFAQPWNEACSRYAAISSSLIVMYHNPQQSHISRLFILYRSMYSNLEVVFEGIS